jgi:penicillin amidase
MTVTRDAHGVPIIRGASLAEMAREQGRTVARDRGWQIELERLRGEGRTAELLGEAGVAWDVFARRAMLEEVAKHAYRNLDPVSRELVDSFVDGVNGGLLTSPVPIELARLGARPGTWQSWTPLAVFLVQNVLFATFPSKWWRERLAAVAGDDVVQLFGLEGPTWSGSNAWAVGGDRTASGLPIVAGDPHRLIESPGVYQQVRLVAPGIDVVGLTFPGVPGVQHFGHTGHVAWGITNAMADYQDLYLERLRRDDDVVMVEGPDGWYDADTSTSRVLVRDGPPVDVEIVVTRNGPVVHGGPGERAYSLRTPSFVLRDLGFDALVPLLRTRTVDDVEQALARWVEPVNDVLVADTTGRVRHLTAGRVPVRAEANRHRPVPGWEPGHEWSGWVESMPCRDVPADGFVVTANERRGPAPWLGTEYAPPHRARRIADLLDAETAVDRAACERIHADTVLATAPRVQKLVADLGGLGDAAARWRDVIVSWDGRMEADSEGAGAFGAFRAALVARIADCDLLAPLHEPTDLGPLFEPWFLVATRVMTSLDAIITDGGDLLGIDLADLARAALEEVASEPPAAWGDRHTLWPLHAADEPPPRTIGLSGDLDCVLSTTAAPTLGDLCFRGPVARYVWDLADRSAGGWVVPLGASGVPGDPHHHDQLDAWSQARLVPLPEETTRATTLPALSVRPIDPVADAEVIHRWVTEDRGSFWMMSEYSLEEVVEVYTWLDEQPTHTASFVLADGEPAAIVQTYRVDAEVEPISRLVEHRPGDLGIHFFVAGGDRRREGWTAGLIAAGAAHVLKDPAIHRLVLDPDVGNARAIGLAERLGAVRGPIVDLGHKTAQVLFLDATVLRPRWWR